MYKEPSCLIVSPCKGLMRISWDNLSHIHYILYVTPQLISTCEWFCVSWWYHNIVKNIILCFYINAGGTNATFVLISAWIPLCSLLDIFSCQIFYFVLIRKTHNHMTFTVTIFLFLWTFTVNDGQISGFLCGLLADVVLRLGKGHLFE